MMEEYGIPEYDAGVLADEKQNADFFEACAKIIGQGKLVSNWFMTDVMAIMNETGKSITESTLTPESLAELITLVTDGTINGSTAKELLLELFEKGGKPGTMVEERGLAQVSDSGEIDRFIVEVFSANEKSVNDYLAGKKAAAGFLVGQVMKLSKGKADPKLVNSMIARKLAEMN